MNTRTQTAHRSLLGGFLLVLASVGGAAAVGWVIGDTFPLFLAVPLAVIGGFVWGKAVAEIVKFFLPGGDQ